MSDFFHPMTQQKSRKQVRCIYCGEWIAPGDVYCKQSGVYDGDWFTNKFHPECWGELAESREFEFSPHDNERPPPPMESVLPPT